MTFRAFLKQDRIPTCETWIKTSFMLGHEYLEAIGTKLVGVYRVRVESSTSLHLALLEAKDRTYGLKLLLRRFGWLLW